jgi:methylase of polypeptide subunit release factors
VSDGPFDLIVSNPPYIEGHTWSELQAEVRRWEDHAALVAPNNGMAFYTRFAYLLPSLLRSQHRSEHLPHHTSSIPNNTLSATTTNTSVLPAIDSSSMELLTVLPHGSERTNNGTPSQASSSIPQFVVEIGSSWQAQRVADLCRHATDRLLATTAPPSSSSIDVTAYNDLFGRPRWVAATWPTF